MSKILIIDDDRTNREMLRVRLESSGHEVTEASNGEEGLRLSVANLPDLVLLDAMMPKIDGWQVCRQMKSSPITKAVPIIMLTACDEKIDQLRGWESGADDYMGKPWNPAKLLELIQTLCQAAENRKRQDVKIM
jgi:DNA-binding response OmpR family regulator